MKTVEATTIAKIVIRIIMTDGSFIDVKADTKETLDEYLESGEEEEE